MPNKKIGLWKPTQASAAYAALLWKIKDLRNSDIQRKVKESMVNIQELAELRLANNRRLRFVWYVTTQSLYIELQEPATRKDGHGYTFVDGLSLQGNELHDFIAALSELQPPELRPAA